MPVTRCLLPLFVVFAAGVELPAAPTEPSTDVVRLLRFLPEKSLGRAGRPAVLTAVVENRGEAAAEVHARLTLPAGMKITGANNERVCHVEAAATKPLAWEVIAEKPGPVEVELHLEGVAPNAARLGLTFLPAMEIQHPPYIPAPQPAPTSLLIGAHHCPLWDADQPQMWSNLKKHPERTPALGFYAQENPEVSDWETKWAVEHGVSFFVYCWYRDGQGGAIKTRFGSAIHDALFKSKFVGQMKFTIMWENQSRGRAGVADEKDLFGNLLPYWIENYFKHPSYLKVDNRPVLFIYRPEFLIKDLGGEEKVAPALNRMREACRAAGFDGLYLLGEYRGQERRHLELMKRLGLDYTFAYCWYVPNSPAPAQAIETQMQYIQKTQDLNALPQVVTVSQAWSGWRDEGSIWKIPPADFETLLRKAKDFVAKLPKEQLSGRMLLLDNWNEWGEGHYIAPYREYGFGYLDAVRKVFAPDAGPHVDLLPEDIGRGPYDAPYWKQTEQAEEVQRQCARRVVKRGGDEPGLVAWWAFDEDDSCPVIFDWSGHRRGGMLRSIHRVKGVDGNALDCQGGCALATADPAFSVAKELTLECWVKTDQAKLPNNWMINRVYGGATSSGYRLGVVQGKPCFEVPLTSFSHHLTANVDLPVGRWVHLAGTFDGKMLRIYVDGRECGSVARPGPLKPNSHNICLGSYAERHAACFRGLLDEVKLYDRALSPAEVQAHYRRFAAVKP